MKNMHLVVCLTSLDHRLADGLAAVAAQEGMSVLHLCRMVDSRLDEAVRRGRHVGDRSTALMDALAVLITSYQRHAEST